MAITILHGEHLINSRQKLNELLTAAHLKHQIVTRLTATELSLSLLEQLFGEADLFENSRLIVIDELHSLPKSQKKEALISELGRLNFASGTLADCLLWEKRSLTVPMLKKFPQAQVLEFKTSHKVFTWLDSFSANQKTLNRQLELLHEALAAEDPFYCLIMLARQIRMLIQVKDGGNVGGAPFMVAKLQKQAQTFTLDQLLRAHHRLLELDLAHKTSTNRLNLAQDLDLFLLRL